MAERNYPNDYFAWFNDDQRLAILSLDTTSTTSGERTTERYDTCLLYTSPSPRDRQKSRMPSSA